jgi:UDP-3-O-[3-hydroxymyristoyl] glucosamine N-acyltransferase
VVIEDDVEIGANTCIDRGAAPDTLIGAGTRIDNLVQIGHNVRVGRACVIVAHAGISGSAVLEDFVVIAGQVGVAGHMRIGRGSRVGAQAGVMTDIPAGEEWVGSPAERAKVHFRYLIALRQMVAERAAARAAKVNNPADGAPTSEPAKEAGSD